MKTIRALIVDDEMPARRMLHKLLADVDDIEIVGEAADGAQAVKEILNHRPNVVFLDIQMPEMNGFQVIEKICLENLPYFIFVTAFDQYAVQAFEVHALDYLLKPFNRDRLLDAVQQIRQKMTRGDVQDTITNLNQLLKTWRGQVQNFKRFAIQTDGEVSFISTNEIEWIEADGKYVRLHTKTGTHLVRESMKHLETILDPVKFLRIHRSYNVNLDYVQSISRWFRGNYRITLRSGTKLTSGKRYRQCVRDLCQNTSINYS